MAAQNTNQATVNASYVINPAKGNVKVVITTKKEAGKAVSAKPVAFFAKNTRYSINNNGGGYTGL